jgi:hypothetical protein
MLGREPDMISFSATAMRANLLRLQNELEAVQANHSRNAIHRYLAAVFESCSSVVAPARAQPIKGARAVRRCDFLLN